MIASLHCQILKRTGWQAIKQNFIDSKKNLFLVTCWISPSTYVTCPLAAYGGSISPWSYHERNKVASWSFPLLATEFEFEKKVVSTCTCTLKGSWLIQLHGLEPYLLPLTNCNTHKTTLAHTIKLSLHNLKCTEKNFNFEIRIFLVKVVNHAISKHYENSYNDNISCVKMDHVLYSINYGYGTSVLS